MRQQAKKCTRQEAQSLSFWRRRGFKIGIGERLPEHRETPPSFATRHPVADALLGLAIIAIVCGLCWYWVASGAGLV